MRDIYPFLLPARQQIRPSWFCFLQIQQCLTLPLSLLDLDPLPVLVLMVPCHILSRWWTRWVVLLPRWWHLIGGIVLRQMVCVTWLHGSKLSGQNNRLQWIRAKSVYELICDRGGWVPNKFFQTWESVGLMIHNSVSNDLFMDLCLLLQAIQLQRPDDTSLLFDAALVLGSIQFPLSLPAMQIAWVVNEWVTYSSWAPLMQWTNYCASGVSLVSAYWSFCKLQSVM